MPYLLIPLDAWEGRNPLPNGIKARIQELMGHRTYACFQHVCVPIFFSSPIQLYVSYPRVCVRYMYIGLANTICKERR